MAVDTICFTAIPTTVRRVITSPADFFGKMPKHGALREPFVFLVCMAAVSGLLTGLGHAATQVLGLELYAGFAMGLVSVIVLPVVYALIAALCGFVVALVVHVLWKFMGSSESYGTSYRCIAYLSALAPLAAVLASIPLLGGTLGIVLFVAYLGSASCVVHGITIQRAWLAFGCVGAIFAVLSVSTRIAAWRFAKNMQQATESWQGATRQMEQTAQEMRQLMDKELERQKEATP